MQTYCLCRSEPLLVLRCYGSHLLSTMAPTCCVVTDMHETLVAMVADILSVPTPGCFQWGYKLFELTRS